MLRIIFQIMIFLSILLPGVVFADDAAGIGGLAGNLMEPISIMTDFVNSGAIIIGASFLFAAFIKYMQYRTNPMAYPISNVVFFLICGLVLLLLPLTYKLIYNVPPTIIENKK